MYRYKSFEVNFYKRQIEISEALDNPNNYYSSLYPTSIEVDEMYVYLKNSYVNLFEMKWKKDRMTRIFKYLEEDEK